MRLIELPETLPSDLVCDLHCLMEAIAEALDAGAALEDLAQQVADGLEVNVLEEGAPTGCLPILLARATLQRRGRAIPDVMPRILSHLLHCMGTTRAVLLVTDHWNPPDFDAFRPDLAEHARRSGVVLLPLLVLRGHAIPLPPEP